METNVKIATLTARERQVLLLLPSGKTTKQIAAELHISEGTVEQHLDHIYKKLGLDQVPGSPRLAAINFIRESQARHPEEI